VIAGKLPDRTQRFLNGQAVKGERNAEAFAAACQLRDAGVDQSETLARILAGARACGLPDREAAGVVRSAYSRGAREGQLVALPGRRIQRIAPALPPKPEDRTLRTHIFNTRVWGEKKATYIQEVTEQRPTRPTEYVPAPFP